MLFIAPFRRDSGTYHLMSVKDPREKSIYQLVSVKGIPEDSIYQLMNVRNPPVERIYQLMSVKGIPADRDFHRMKNANRRDNIHPDPNAMRVINSRGFQPTVRVGAIYGLAGAKLLDYIYYIRYRKRKRGSLAASPSLIILDYATLLTCIPVILCKIRVTLDFVHRNRPVQVCFFEGCTATVGCTNQINKLNFARSC